MGAVYIEMLPLILGAALLPLWIIIVLTLLGGENGLARGAAFVGGVTLMRLLQGVAFGFIFTGSNNVGAAGGPGPIASTLLLVLGLLLLITAYKQWSQEPDPDAPPPKLLASLADMTPFKAFAVGTLLVTIAAKLWVFTLGAISTIGAAGLNMRGSVIAYLLFIFSAQILIILPVLAYALAPAWSNRKLGSVRG